jgi:hypothetical protein
VRPRGSSASRRYGRRAITVFRFGAMTALNLQEGPCARPRRIATAMLRMADRPGLSDMRHHHHMPVYSYIPVRDRRRVRATCDEPPGPPAAPHPGAPAAARRDGLADSHPRRRAPAAGPGRDQYERACPLSAVLDSRACAARSAGQRRGCTRSAHARRGDRPARRRGRGARHSARGRAAGSRRRRDARGRDLADHDRGVSRLACTARSRRTAGLSSRSSTNTDGAAARRRSTR